MNEEDMDSAILAEQVDNMGDAERYLALLKQRHGKDIDLDQLLKEEATYVRVQKALSFYENKLTTDADVQIERDEDNLKAGIWEDHKKTVTWCDIQAKESRLKDSYSTKNDGEADYSKGPLLEEVPDKKAYKNCSGRVLYQKLTKTAAGPGKRFLLLH